MRNDPTRHSEDSEMEMTPMIDVTFLLLIFFMCTLRFKTLEGRLAAHLPQGVGVNPGDDPPPLDVEVQVHILDPGTRLAARGEEPWSGRPGTRYRFGEDRRVAYAVGPRRLADLEAVGSRLSELRQADPERPVVLAPGAGVVNAEVVQLLDVVIDSGFSEVRLQGAPEDR